MTNQTATVCPCCHRALPKTRAIAVADTATMGDAEMIAYCKRTGLREDTRFFLRVCPDMPADVRAETVELLAALEQRASKPADAKLLNQLRDRARMARGWTRFPCSDPTHSHYDSLNAERCDEARELAAVA